MSRIRRVIKIILTKISPKLETSINYRYTMGEWLDWKKPQNINAKLSVLKCTQYYNNEEVTQCIDKYGIREWLKRQDMEWLCPKLYGVYETPEDIDWDALPESFVIKCNHTCGANIIVPNKQELDIADAMKKLKKWYREDYWIEGEVQYKYIKKRIIAEEYLGGGDDLKTYKFFCFQGIPKVLYISLEEDKYINYYDINFKRLPYKLYGHDNYCGNIEKPIIFDNMVDVAKKLSKKFPFVRVDLYDSFGKIYISELTFIPTGGFMKITPRETIDEWGEWLELQEIR